VDVVHCVDAFRLVGIPPGPEPDEHPNITVHPLRSPLGALSPLLSHQSGSPLLKSRALEDLTATHRYDVIHFHNISLFGPRVLETGGPEPVKLYTAHDCWLICPTHVLWKFERELCREPQCLQCVLRSRKPPQLWRYTGLLAESARNVDQFLAPSRFSAALHRERGFQSAFEYLPNFCERADSDWKKPGVRANERPYFLYAGRLEAIKGLQTVIPLWRNVQGFDLLIAGSGSHEAELRALSAEIPGVRFVGRLSQSALGGLYAHAEALVVPSLTYEVFGLVVIEALARKTPVIARDLGGLSEVINESGGGCLYQRDEDLLECVCRLGADRRLRDEKGEQGYRYFLAHWTREAHLERYWRVIHEAGSRKRSC
jgi:glycosyltransferase involved in cell wall biosynthesis